MGECGEDFVLDFLVQELEFDDLKEGLLLFQIGSSDPGVYRYSLPLPSFSGVMCVMNESSSEIGNPLTLLEETLHISLLDLSMKIIGRCSIPFQEDFFQTEDLSHSHLLWTYEYDSILNHAIGVGTRNGSIKGLVNLYRLPRYTQTISMPPPPVPEEEMEEQGEGSLEMTEFLPSELDSESEFEEPPDPILIPKASSEPQSRPLFHFMTVGDQRQTQTEYRPGYRSPTAHRSVSPPRQSVNRPRWLLSQSIQSTNPAPPLRDHLLRCVACWLRSVQCQDCLDGQTQLDQWRPGDTIPSSHAAALPPRPPRHPSPPQDRPPPPPLQRVQRPSAESSTKGSSSQGKKKPSQAKPRSTSQPRPRQAPKPQPSSSSSRLRQHTFSTAIAIKPHQQQQSVNKTTRGFHFVNPQPETLAVERRVPRSPPSRAQAPARTVTAGDRRSSSKPLGPPDHQEQAPLLSPNSSYPKASSPLMDRSFDERGEIIFLTPTTRLRMEDDDASPAVLSAWEEEEGEQLLYIAG
jgi:hypothetical protein